MCGGVRVFFLVLHTQRGRESERERERERKRERHTDRQTDRQTESERETERELGREGESAGCTIYVPADMREPYNETPSTCA